MVRSDFADVDPRTFYSFQSQILYKKGIYYMFIGFHQSPDQLRNRENHSSMIISEVLKFIRNVLDKTFNYINKNTINYKTFMNKFCYHKMPDFCCLM